jgi:hypothetical protein
MKKNKPTNGDRQKRRQLRPGQLRQSYLAIRDEDPEFKERWGYIDYEEESDDYWDYCDPYEDYLDQHEIDDYQLEQFLTEILNPVVPFVDLSEAATVSEFPEYLNTSKSVTEEKSDEASIEERLVEYVRLVEHLKDNSFELKSRIVEAGGSPKTIDLVKSAFPKQPVMVMNILLFSPFWIRDPWTWSKGNEISLLDHLFVKHEVPDFLYSEWFREWTYPRLKWVVWFILYGQGGSLKVISRLYWWSITMRLPQHLQDMPPDSSAIEAYLYEDVKRSGGSEILFNRRLEIATTRYRWVIPNRFPQYLWEVPGDLSPVEACIYAEVKRLGGSEIDFRRILQNPALVIDPTNPSTDKSFSSFWHNTVKWLITHRDAVTDEECRQILPWALHMYTEAGPHGERRFSWRGRSVNSVINRSIEYRRSLLRTVPSYKWHSHGWDWDSDDSFADRWSFVELTSSVELSIEGSQMHHCVAIHAAQCASGFSTIVSVRKNDIPCVTLQINLTSNGIVQARGLCNRKTTSQEKDVINLWLRTIVHRKPPK